MPPALIGFLVALALVIAYLTVQARRAGPRQLPEADLVRARIVARATSDAPGHGWSQVGSRTEADGLNLKFEHDDDPQAEATFLADPNAGRTRGSLAHNLTVRLGTEFQTYHVHTRGHVFRVRMRGTGPVVGKEVRIQMHVAGDGTPVGGSIENDDDTDAAVGGWIEVESVEILRVVS